MDHAVVLTALLLSGLAGCAQAPSDEGGATFGDGQRIEFDDANVTYDTGAISGVVVDETIAPVAGATVRLLGSDATATTGPVGGFTFEGLEPGFYSITANGTGFFEVQATAEVVAGAVEKLRMVLTRDTSPEPFHETLQFNWFDTFGQPLVDYAFDVFRPEGAPAACDVCEWTFESAGPVETLFIEAVWEYNIPPPHTTGEFYWDIEPTADSSDREWGYFESPGLARIDGNRWFGHTEFFLMLMADEYWIVVDQDAEVFVSLFYVRSAPDGWSFVDA